MFRFTFSYFCAKLQNSPCGKSCELKKQEVSWKQKIHSFHEFLLENFEIENVRQSQYHNRFYEIVNFVDTGPRFWKIGESEIMSQNAEDEEERKILFRFFDFSIELAVHFTVQDLHNFGWTSAGPHATFALFLTIKPAVVRSIKLCVIMKSLPWAQFDIQKWNHDIYKSSRHKHPRPYLRLRICACSGGKDKSVCILKTCRCHVFI